MAWARTEESWLEGDLLRRGIDPDRLSPARLLSVLHSAWLDELIAEGGSRLVRNRDLPSPPKDVTVVPLSRAEHRKRGSDALRAGDDLTTVAARLAQFQAADPDTEPDVDSPEGRAAIAAQVEDERAAFIAEQQARNRAMGLP